MTSSLVREGDIEVVFRPNRRLFRVLLNEEFHYREAVALTLLPPPALLAFLVSEGGRSIAPATQVATVVSVDCIWCDASVRCKAPHLPILRVDAAYHLPGDVPPYRMSDVTDNTPRDVHVHVFLGRPYN